MANSFGIAVQSEYMVVQLNEDEKKWCDRLSLMLRCAESGEIHLRERQELIRNDLDYENGDEEWDFEEEEEEAKPKVKKEITKDMLDDALRYYRSSKRKRNFRGQGVRSLESMSSRFRWIDSQKVLNMLSKYESTGEVPKNRNEQLEKLALLLDEEVEQAINEGRQFSDFELREMALSINRENNLWPKFKCSPSWTLKWKKRFKVSSRRITGFVSLKTERDEKKTLELIEKLRKDVEEVMKINPGIALWNCDQTGIVKECYSARTLARTGVKRVKARTQSKCAMTHSITYLPVIGSDGYQHDRVFIQLGEQKGQLPKSGCYTDNRTELAVEKSHIMSKESAGQFFKNVLFGGNLPKKLILLLDSWPVFRDHDFIRSFAPATVDLYIFNIPPGGTSICQPADLSYNHQLKGIQKKLNMMIMFRNIKYRISQRDNLLKFASQVHWILGSPRFKSFIAYGFYKGGFVNAKPAPFDGPKQYIFGTGSFNPCQCSNQGCTLCPRCDISFCFNCFWVDMHRC
ncbi:unnamed protein product [Caenorhabditis nigoni]